MSGSVLSCLPDSLERRKDGINTLMHRRGVPPLGSISERKAVISRAAEELEETAEAAVRRVLRALRASKRIAKQQ